MNPWQVLGQPRVIYARREKWLVWSNRRVIVAQIAEKVHARSDRKLSECTVQFVAFGAVYLQTGCLCWLVFTNGCHVCIRTGPRSYWSRWPGVTYLRNSWQQDALWEECKLAGSVMLRVMFCWETLGSPIHVDVVLTRCRPFHQNSTHWWLSPLCALPQSKRNGSRMVWILQQWLWDVDLTSKFSRSGQKSPIHGIPILKFKG